MKFKNNRRARIISTYIIGWILAFMFLMIVRGSGTIERGSVQMDFVTALPVIFIFGIFFGSISALAQIFTEERIYQRISIQKLLLLRVMYAIAFLFAIILISYAMVITFFGVTISLKEYFIEPGSFAIYFYFITVDFFLTALRQVNLMLGGNNLGKLITGRFYTPTEEERVFMFLDLQSSTQHAERLGHIVYSKLIQDCFNDLGVVAKHDAEIYQYVGDEVVLTWKLNEALKKQMCLHAYYAFANRLNKRADYYEQNYQCKPFFKAGMHAGTVTVTEVGKYKKEIAYHGDAINTAARIQSKCNEYKAGLLVSGYLQSLLETEQFTFNELGAIPLRGKKEEVSIYSVTE
ncbi:MAG: adenylate/guanylate cyclase domain-containing protein [Bacteroidia bacterium]|nr:adenylate/guanylate cyclase domain-containing protein [Bacteroidia bacterium]